MSRKVQRVPYRLDPGDVRNLPRDEIAAILRGADEMIGRGGRTQLSKLLKGSREAAVLEHGLDRSPSYGFYRALAIEDILHRVDWVIANGYLAVEYAYRLPILTFTDRGWAIEMETMANELLAGFDRRLSQGPPYDCSDLNDRDRPMILLVLDKVEASGRRDLIPILYAWMEIDYAKIRARIARVIRALAPSSLSRHVEDRHERQQHSGDDERRSERRRDAFRRQQHHRHDLDHDADDGDADRDALRAIPATWHSWTPPPLRCPRVPANARRGRAARRRRAR
jgi:hypothetical protein